MSCVRIICSFREDGNALRNESDLSNTLADKMLQRDFGRKIHYGYHDRERVRMQSTRAFFAGRSAAGPPGRDARTSADVEFRPLNSTKRRALNRESQGSSFQDPVCPLREKAFLQEGLQQETIRKVDLHRLLLSEVSKNRWPGESGANRRRVDQAV